MVGKRGNLKRALKREKVQLHPYESKEYILLNKLTAESPFKAKIVSLILSKDTEKALELLSHHYRVAKPKLKVGMPKRYSKKLACYVAKKQMIYVFHRKLLYNPQVILHEFYHHFRNFTDAQKGIEKYAKKFAEDYLKAYRIIAASQDLAVETSDE